MKRSGLALLLALATTAVYAQTVSFELVHFDDLKYVARNARVQAGLDWETLRWALATDYFSNWHPLTWISYALDVELLGGGAAAHHATNVVLHVANAVLLFALLERSTGRPGRSAFAAGLFALHPLHVESVAWVSERKDVLSLFLGLLATGAWVGWTRRGGRHRYAAAAALLALGLMAKPILVTLPLVFLLLDYWPLGRLTGRRGAARLVVEKLPLLALSAASSAITLAVQSGAGATRPEEVVPLALRGANALASLSEYLRATLWPRGLCVYYPHPYLPGGSGLDAGSLALAAAVVLGASLAAFRGRARGYPVTGWLWYLGTLVPNLGLIQVGMQARADRYTYLPLVGIFLWLAWGGAGWLERRFPNRPRLATAAALAVLAPLAVASFHQVGTWRDSVTLYEHALAHTEGNWLVHYNLAQVWLERGRPGDAERQLREALRISPGRADASFNLALALGRQGRAEEALEQYRRTVLLEPTHPKARRTLAKRLYAAGDLDAAIRHWRAAARGAPGNRKIALEHGVALLEAGRREEAEPELLRAVALATPRGDAATAARARAAIERLRAQSR